MGVFSGVQLYYKFEIGDVDPTNRLANYAKDVKLFDGSVAVNGASLTSSSYMVGRSSLHLDGTRNQYIQIPRFEVSGTQGLSFSFWVKGQLSETSPPSFPPTAVPSSLLTGD